MAGTVSAGSTPAESEEKVAPESLPEHLEDYWDEPGPMEAAVEADRDGLQGAWVTVAGRRAGELLIAGNRFTVRFLDGAIYMGVFDLGPLAQPKTMDMRIDAGPARHLGKTALCIYDLQGDLLRWYPAEPGKKERPTAFAAEDDPEHLSLRFRREGPA